MKIPFKKTYYDEAEVKCVNSALIDGVDYTAKVRRMLEAHYGGASVFLTASASAAFDLLFEALELPRGGEVILPSFTYPSVANTVLRYGLKPVFADICEDTKVLDLGDVEAKKCKDTCCVIPTHYGGASVDFSKLKTLCGETLVVEDAALSFGAMYNKKPLGSVGDFGIVSFHNTKNVSADQGGVLIVGKANMHIADKIQTIYDNGTDRQAFEQGKVDAYSWQRQGSSVAMANVNAAILFAQMQKADEIFEKQDWVYHYYQKNFSKIEDVAIPTVPPYNDDNAHVFYLVFNDFETREAVRRALDTSGIGAHFHYMPLHASAMGKRLGYGADDLPVTQEVSQRMLRLPIYASLTQDECADVVSAVTEALRR